MSDYSQPQAVLDAAESGNLHAYLHGEHLARQQRQTVAADAVRQDVVSELMRIPLSPELARALALPVTPGDERAHEPDLSHQGKRQTGEIIIHETCAKYRVSKEELKSGSRVSLLVQARFEVFWRMKRETHLTLPTIGRLVGGKDHTTVLHGVRRYEEIRAYVRLMGAGPLDRWDLSKIILDEDEACNER